MTNCASFSAIMGQAIGTRKPSSPIADGLIAELVRRAMIAEPAFAHCWVHLQLKGKRELGGDPMTVNGEIAIRVVDGTVMLDGEVCCLGQKRLAGALAWWVPGSRTVINALRVTPPEEDSETAITDAVRLLLKKDPFVNADLVQVTTRKATVTLDGSVPTKLAREIAEHDAWYVYGVEEVVNRIAID
jgi:osmotically-inducible protein OsmY